jgi:hypothetical protein
MVEAINRERRSLSRAAAVVHPDFHQTLQDLGLPEALAQTSEEVIRNHATRRPHSATGRMWQSAPSFTSQISSKASTPQGSRRVLTPSDLRAGDAVSIAGVTRRAEFNGLSGDVVSKIPDGAGRVCVQLRSDLSKSSSASGKVLRIKPERLALGATRRAASSSGGSTASTSGARMSQRPRSASTCSIATSGEADRAKSILESLRTIAAYRYPEASAKRNH